MCSHCVDSDNAAACGFCVAHHDINIPHRSFLSFLTMVYDPDFENPKSETAESFCKRRNRARRVSKAHGQNNIVCQSAHFLHKSKSAAESVALVF